MATRSYTYYRCLSCGEKFKTPLEEKNVVCHCGCVDLALLLLGYRVCGKWYFMEGAFLTQLLEEFFLHPTWN